MVQSDSFSSITCQYTDKMTENYFYVGRKEGENNHIYTNTLALKKQDAWEQNTRLPFKAFLKHRRAKI